MNNSKKLFQVISVFFILSVFVAALGLFLRQPVPVEQNNSVTTNVATTQNILQELLVEKYSISAEDIAVIVTQESLEHARGVVRYPNQQEAGIVLATIGLGEWELVYDGTGAVACEDLDARNFPESMTFDCEYTGSNAPILPSGAPVKAVTNYEECVSAGNPILESFPEQCEANGIRFIKEVSIPVEAEVSL